MTHFSDFFLPDDRGSGLEGPARRAAGHRAFSLVELLTVVSLVLFMLGMSVPGFLSLKAGLDVQNGALKAANCLEVARQAARTLNRQAEFRLYADGTGFGKMQVFVAGDQGSEWTAWTKPITLPDTVQISGDPTYSTLLETMPGTPTVDANGRAYRRFRFLADGSADFSGAGNRTLTLVLKRDSETMGTGGGQLPPNYAVIQIDPEVGAVTVFQP